MTAVTSQPRHLLPLTVLEALDVGVRDQDRSKIEAFSQMVPAIILSGPCGVAVTGGRPQAQEVRVELIKGLASGSREFAVYLPLYNGVEFLKVGVRKGASFEGLKPRAKPVVF